jgi:arylsulfatase A-like enzyme
MISIDTLRADRLGILGYERGLTPNLDRLAEGGAVFLQATSTSPWTLPSHGSVFTSMLPFDHGGRWYHAPIRPRRSMLAERFRNAGYRTAAFTGGAWMDGDRGFYQGFGVYREYEELAPGGSEELWAAAAGWVRRLGGRPYFLFVHTYEPHTPYLRSDFAALESSGRVGRTFTMDELWKLRSGEWELSPRERLFVTDLYDGDVANSDRRMGSFLAEVGRSGGLDDTIVVVFSDHGEDLWDHEPTRSADHGHSLYEELLRVPLIFWNPGRIRAATRVETPVSLLDVAPTVLALAGLPTDSQHKGRSLTETLTTGTEPESRPVFAESVEYGPDRFSARDGDLKVIVTPFPEHARGGVQLKVDSLEIFDLATDPLERRSLAGTPDERALEVALSLMRRAQAKIGHQRVMYGQPELSEQSRALGYVQ